VEPRPQENEIAEASKLRSFIALPLGESVRHLAEERVRALRERSGGDGVRWVRPENLHVTLRFLGNIERTLVPKLAAAVREELAGLASFTAQIGGVRTFPSSKRPRVVVLEVGPEAALSELASAVERGVGRVGLAAEERPFRPHLTLGRAKRSGRAAGFPDTSDLVSSEGVSFEVTESVLFQSELLRSGARYTALERFPLIHPRIHLVRGEAGA
jgi:2'-5' RNA ligase